MKRCAVCAERSVDGDDDGEWGLCKPCGQSIDRTLDKRTGSRVWLILEWAARRARRCERRRARR